MSKFFSPTTPPKTPCPVSTNKVEVQYVDAPIRLPPFTTTDPMHRRLSWWSVKRDDSWRLSRFHGIPVMSPKVVSDNYGVSHWFQCCSGWMRCNPAINILCKTMYLDYMIHTLARMMTNLPRPSCLGYSCKPCYRSFQLARDWLHLVC